jgi:small subunit ribosomal protein S1
MVMDEEKKNINSELAKLYEESIANVQEGQIVKGKIVQIGEKEILVDIGYKSEGVIYKSEIPAPEALKVGDEIDVMLESKENDSGMVVLSHEKAKKLKGWQNIVDNFKEGDNIEGIVYRKVRGGFMVDVGIEAFLPASLSVMQEFGGADNLVKQRLNFKIVKINIPRKNIVLSRKEIVDEKRQEEKAAMIGNLNTGDIVAGIVRNITDFGVFVDIGGGITGLLHITDMSWGRVSHPGEVVSVGDKIDVMILDFDKNKMKVSLGLKQKTANPWDGVDEKYTEGSVIKGKVVNIMPYGVFVELEEGIEGLIHISEFSWSKKFSHPSEKFSVGDEVEAAVLKVDRENQKLSLGIKQLEGNPWEGVEERFKVGDKIKGMVNAITDYGAFVELEKGVEGLVHVSDLSWTKRVTHPKEVLKKGEEIEAIILNVDEQNKRIALGVKQLTPDPWDEITKKYEVGTECEGVITNITNFGIFIELEKDLEGLLHVSEVGLDPSQKIEEAFKVGDNLKVKVIHIDGIQKKIALSRKGLENEQPAQEEDKEA